MSTGIPDDVVISKVQSLQRCIGRAREEYRDAGDDFPTDYTRQDAAILNITRACEQAIDLANHTIRAHTLGIPTSSRESFSLLAREGIISRDLAQRMKKMVGFRNIAVHQYEDLDIEIVTAVIGTGLDDLLKFTDAVVSFLAGATDPG